MDPKLFSLLKVYETGSFTRAARQLSLTQPAVSQHIRALEKQLNVRIFDRSSGALHVTHEGEVVIRTARRMLSLYHNLQEELTSEKRQLSSLTVGITHTAESNAIAGALAKYVDRHENVTIRITTDTAARLYAMLKNYELDFAIVEGRTADPALEQLQLDTDCLVLAVSPHHRLSGRKMVTIEDLKQEKMILRRPESNTRNLFVASLESHNLRIDEFNVVMEIDNIATIKDLIRRDFGVSVLAKSVCLDELRKNKIVVLPVENLSMEREINLVYSADFEHPELLHEIIADYNETRSTLTDA